MYRDREATAVVLNVICLYHHCLLSDIAVELRECDKTVGTRCLTVSILDRYKNVLAYELSCIF